MTERLLMGLKESNQTKQKQALWWVKFATAGHQTPRDHHTVKNCGVYFVFLSCTWDIKCHASVTDLQS